MSFSYGGYNFDVAALSEKASRGKTNSDFTAYVATNGGNVSPPAAASAARSYYEDNFPDLIPFLQVDSEFINAKHALVSVTLNETKLDPVSFNTTGATTHINQSLLTRGIYAAPGKIAPNYRGAIGVSDSGVSGVDVTVPAFEFSVRKKFELVSTSYLLAVVSMTGRTNSAAMVDLRSRRSVVSRRRRWRGRQQLGRHHLPLRRSPQSTKLATRQHRQRQQTRLGLLVGEA